MPGEESAAANGVIVAINAAQIAAQIALAPPRFVPFIPRWTALAQFIYFVPSAVARGVKLTIFRSKELTLKVFGSGQ